MDAQILPNERFGAQSERRLWSAVLDQAFADLSNAKTRESACRWFLSVSWAPGSLFWICAHLEIDPGSLRRWVSFKPWLSINHPEMIV
jgi:hypothetical protein